METGSMTVPIFMRIHWKGFLMILIPIVFLIFLAINDNRNFRCLYVIITMITCWVTEVIPIPVASLMPVTLMPMLDILVSERTCINYFRSILTHFVISMIIGRAAVYTYVHKRVAVHMLRWTQTDPRKLHFSCMVIASVMSTMISNAMLISLIHPFVDAIVEGLAELGLCKVYVDENAPKHLKKASRICECFQLSVAYSTTAGGAGFIIGSVTSKNLRKLYNRRFKHEPAMEFSDYAYFSLLPTILLEAFLIYYMRRVYFRDEEKAEIKLGEADIRAANEINNDKYNNMGPATFAQYLVGSLFVFVVSMVISRDPVFTSGWSDDLSPNREILDASVVACAVFLIFALPADLAFLKCWDESSKARTPAILVWSFCMYDIPWELIFIVGCSGALIEGARSSGLGKNIGEIMDDCRGFPLPLCLLYVILMTSCVTNLLVNSFAMLLVGPGIVEMGFACKVNPMYFMYPANLACNWAFVMPTATPPNALIRFVYKMNTWKMVKRGIPPTMVGILISFIFGAIWSHIIFDDMDILPDWVADETSPPDWGESNSDYKETEFQY